MITLFSVDPDRLRAEAERVLSQPKYRVDTTTGERLRLRLMDLWLRFLDLLDTLAGLVGGPVVLSLLILGAVVAAAVLVSRNLGKRRAREIEERIRREHALARGVDPAELEGLAAEAARSGDHRGAVRLLFRAGLLRLDEQDRIRYRPGLTRTEIGEVLRSEVFERLATRFDQVVYRGDPATESDYQQAQEGWRALLGEPAAAGWR